MVYSIPENVQTALRNTGLPCQSMHWFQEGSNMLWKNGKIELRYRENQGWWICGNSGDGQLWRVPGESRYSTKGVPEDKVRFLYFADGCGFSPATPEEERDGILSVEVPVTRDLDDLQREAMFMEDPRFFEGLMSCGYTQVRMIAGRGQHTPHDVLNRLAKGNTEERCVAAAHPKLSLKLMEDLSKDSALSVLMALVENHKVPNDVVLDVGMRVPSESRHLAAAVMSRLKTVEGSLVNEDVVLRVLSRSENWVVRSEVASHPRTPREALEVLALDEVTVVQQRVVENPNCTESILRKVADATPPLDVQKALAGHPKLPLECLLSLDGRDCFWETLLSNLKGRSLNNGDLLKVLASLDAMQQAQFVMSLTPEQQMVAAARVDTPGLAVLTNNMDWRVRNAVAKQPQTPSSLLELLGDDESWEVQVSVAQHPSAKYQTRKALLESSYPAVREALVAVPKLSGDVMAGLLTDSSENVRKAALEQAKGWSSSRMRALVEDKSLPAEVLEALSRTRPHDEHLQFEIARNPSTSVATLKRLCVDKFGELWIGAPTSFLKQWAETGMGDERKWLAGFSDRPAVNDILLQDTDIGVTEAIVVNPHLTVDQIREAADARPELVPLFAKNIRNTKERLGLAASVSTPPEILRELATGWSDQVLCNVAMNPNTEQDVLLSLSNASSSQVRTAVTKNPNTSLAVLLSIVERASAASLEHLAEHSNMRVRRSVAELERTPVETLARLANDTQLEVRRAVSKNPSTPPEALTSLFENSTTCLLYLLAQHPKTPPEILQKLAVKRIGSTVLKEIVAENPNTTPDTLQDLANSHNWWVRSCVAKNPNAPVEILRALSQDAQVDESLAGNPALPLDLLEQLARSEYAATAVARNPSTTPELLDVLSESADMITRMAVVHHPRVRPGTVEKLARDPSIYVRSEIADHSDVVSALQLLAHDEFTIRKKVAKRLPDLACGMGVALQMASIPQEDKVFEYLSSHPMERVQCALVQNPSVPESVLVQIAQRSRQTSVLARLMHCSSVEARVPLAGRALCDPEFHERHARAETSPRVLEKLGKKGMLNVSGAVAENPYTPLATRVALSHSGSSYIREAAVRSGKLPFDRLLELVEDEDCMVRHHAIQDPRLSEDFLRGKVDHPDPMVRVGLALNPKTPSEVLEELKEDPATADIVRERLTQVAVSDSEESGPAMGSVVGEAIVTAVLSRFHPAAALATQTGRDLVVAGQVQKALKGVD